MELTATVDIARTRTDIGYDPFTDLTPEQWESFKTGTILVGGLPVDKVKAARAAFQRHAERLGMSPVTQFVDADGKGLSGGSKALPEGAVAFKAHLTAKIVRERKPAETVAAAAPAAAAGKK